MSSPTPQDTPQEPRYVGRGGHKLRHALTAFDIHPTGLTCADFGCSTGGFTDCLLQAGAAKVYAIDTAYGQLAWTLRKDPRVQVMERTNALHAQPPEVPVDLVVADLGWTPQRLLVPVAMKWLRPGGHLITLIKPHYEFKDRGGKLPPKGILPEEQALEITHQTVALLAAAGFSVRSLTKSPVLGGADLKGKGGGNAEWLAVIARDT
ncbi:MAG: SAM-dependent methyltransferase [Phycisphaerales bacterium]